MQIVRPFSYWLVCRLRIAIPALVLAVVAIACWDYVLRRDKREPRETGWRLQGGLKSRVDGRTTLVRTEGNRTLFRIQGKSSLEFKDGRNTLEDVEITVFGSGPVERVSRIRSKYCSMDQRSAEIRCNRDVEFEGSMKAEAGNLKYDLDRKLLTLSSNVRIETGDVLLTSATSSIRTSVDTANSERLNSGAQSATAGNGLSPGPPSWTLDADTMEIDVSSEGVAQKVTALGNARVNELAGAGRKLTGGEIDVEFDAFGKFAYVEARRNSLMTFGPGRTLISDRIRTSVSGSVETSGSSVLKLGVSVIEGTRFSIWQERQGESIVFETLERSHLKDGLRQSSADRTEAQFDSRTNRLRELTQTGKLEFQTAEYKGRAENARFEPGGGVLVLAGSASISDRAGYLDAGQMVLNLKDHSVLATGNVRSVAGAADESLVVTAARAQGRPGLMVYAGNVRLARGSLQVRADRLQAFSQGPRFRGEGSVQSDLDSIHASSPNFDYDVAAGLLRHSGGAHLQNRGMVLDAREIQMKLSQRNLTEITATGTAAVTWGQWRGSAQRVVYQAATDSALLTGSARGRSEQHGTIEGIRLEINERGARVPERIDK